MRQLLLILVCIFIPLKAVAEDAITVASGEWPPLTGGNLKHGGFCTHVLSKALEKHKLKITYLPWKRARNMVMVGDFDITPCWIKSAERLKTYIFSDPIMVLKKVFFHRKDLDFHWNSFNDLKQYRIGAALGYSYGDKFDRAEKENRINVERAPEDANNFRKLLLGRIDLYPIETVVGYTTLQKLFPPSQVNQITNHPKELIRSTYHLMISKKILPERAERILVDFNEGMKNLRESGEYKNMEELLIHGYYDPAPVIQ